MMATEPFPSSRVKIMVPALLVQSAAHIASHGSPQVQFMQSGANMDESEVATSTHFFSPHTG